MRITEIAAPGSNTQLRVEGYITQQTVEELMLLSAAHLIDQGSLVLDLSGVRFADPDGVKALRQLVPQGAVLKGCSGFLTELLRSDDSGDDEPENGEASLIVRLRRGDERAFEQLVRDHGGRMLATARRMLGTEDDARDAVQDAFLSASKAISTFSGRSKLSTWLHRIVVNAALMKIRSRRRRPEESIDDLLPRFDAQGEWASGMAVTSVPSDLLEQRETRHVVRRCIDRLPEVYRTVLMMRDIEDLDTDEVAALLQITPNAVKIRLHRARQSLRTLLDTEL